MAVAGEIELHYYLAENRHSMDALLRNQCESELLALFQEVSSVLGVPIAIEAQALREGGLKELWKMLGENSPQLSVVLSVTAILIALASQSHQSDVDKLSEQLMEQKIEKTQLQIEKLQKEIRHIQNESEGSIKENAIHFLQRDSKVVVRRSNFYKKLKNDRNVTSVGITPYGVDHQPIQEERNVPRNHFDQFILSSQTLKPKIIDEATIQLVSPVLREGKLKWKGIYDDQVIGFAMHDPIFRGQVLRNEVTFQHDTKLDCVLVVNRKLDEVGEVVITDYAVKTVIKKYDDAQSFETSQGREYKQAKKFRDSQHDMFPRSGH